MCVFVFMYDIQRKKWNLHNKWVKHVRCLLFKSSIFPSTFHSPSPVFVCMSVSVSVCILTTQSLRISERHWVKWSFLSSLSSTWHTLLFNILSMDFCHITSRRRWKNSHTHIYTNKHAKMAKSPEIKCFTHTCR